MSNYRAPLEEMRFVMDELAGFAELGTSLPAYVEATPDMADAILDEAARFAGEVLAPLNRVGDTEGCTLHADGVTTPTGWAAAYRAFCEAGWNGIALSSEYGGHGQPESLAVAVKEMACSANLSFSLCPTLTGGAVAALVGSASDELKATYVPKMVSGEWTGTMNLTEPQAGSDLALIRSRAEPQGDGSYRIFGQKIFITYGEHDLADNIIHLVLARLPDAPAGVKGISLFVVPKVLVNADGSLGERNDVRCVSIEHKLGIHASPTCVLAFGDEGTFGGGAVGYLVGQVNRGIEYMFIMMNEARLGVGLQGIGLGERAYQHALAYARERKQGRDAVTGEALVSIDHHPDVRRMLLRMKSQVEASRALAYVTAGTIDRAHAHPDAAERKRNQLLSDFLIPLVKAGSTEMAIEVASLGIQIHGGMGFIEETGVAQYWRDARITTIYEGTTGIQANDLVFRKVLRDNGETAQIVFAEVRATADALTDSGSAALQRIGRWLTRALDAWADATLWVVANARQDSAAVLAASTPYLQLAVCVSGGWQLGRAALISAQRLAEQQGNARFHEAKINTAGFYAEHFLTQADGLCRTVLAGATSLAEFGDEMF